MHRRVLGETGQQLSPPTTGVLHKSWGPEWKLFYPASDLEIKCQKLTSLIVLTTYTLLKHLHILRLALVNQTLLGRGILRLVHRWPQDGDVAQWEWNAGRQHSTKDLRDAEAELEPALGRVGRHRCSTAHVHGGAEMSLQMSLGLAPSFFYFPSHYSVPPCSHS